jgi:hypothetical protein
MTKISGHKDCITVDVIAIQAIRAHKELSQGFRTNCFQVLPWREASTVLPIRILDNHRILVARPMHNIETRPGHVSFGVTSLEKEWLG